MLVAAGEVAAKASEQWAAGFSIPALSEGGPYDVQVPSSKPSLSAEERVRWLEALGFKQGPPGDERWSRIFPNGYAITATTAGTGTIDYGVDIKLGRHTINTLTIPENLVVLDCVCVLLDAGYPPSSIELEKTFPLGHQPGGHLDVMVSKDGVSYLMIECKTAGREYSGALTKLRTVPASQLMTYVQQDRNAQHAVLFSARLDGSGTKKSAIARTYAGFSTVNLVGQNPRDLFRSWDKETYTSGLEDSPPFALNEARLTVGDLQDMTQEDGSRLFDSFKEILRRHAVSDKPNAFNKIFNLFVCKIQDEEKVSPKQTTEFQWLVSESATTALDRLTDLYERGMHQYLNLRIGHSVGEIEKLLEGLPVGQQAKLTELFASARQFSNTAFSFVDVYDQRSFDQNALIVRDIVRLLQRKRLRYTQKHSFMGMFFEKLLSTSVKQESGQYFTPTPIAQFVCESLPIEHLVDEKLLHQDPKFLPYVIDYAAGSGHFLTEYMDRTDKVLRDRVSGNQLTTKAQQDNAGAWQHSYRWAAEFVYGVELDHRLAKTAKVSTFLHGDGEANVIRGNGLGHFFFDQSYREAQGDRLRKQSDDGDMDHPNFDVVVANPPYSVPEFRQSIPDGELSFSLFPRLTESSDEIEALFIERTKQLLRDGGVAGIVLPTSILTNPSIERDARRLLLRSFELVALVSLGQWVFVATKTPTVVLFLRRRSNTVAEGVEAAIKTFFATYADTHANGMQDVFARYADDVHGTSLAELIDALKDPASCDLPIFETYGWAYNHDKSRQSDLPLKEVDETGREVSTQAFLRFVREQEEQRMLGYLLTRGQKVLLVNAPEDIKANREFLGYEFSNRKKHEGIALLSGTGDIDSPLFDPNDPSDPTKLSTLIKAHFAHSPVAVPPNLTSYAELVDLDQLVNLKDMAFTWDIATQTEGPERRYALPTERLGTVCDVVIGGTPSRQQPQYFRGSNLWLSVGEMNGQVVTDTIEKITDDAVKESNVKLVRAGTVLVSFKLSIGKTAVAGKDLYTNEAIASLPVRSPDDPSLPWVDDQYLATLLRLFPSEILRFSGKNRKKFGQSLSMGYLKRLPVPLATAELRATIQEIDADVSLTDDEKRALIGRLLWVNEPSAADELDVGGLITA